MKLAVLKIIIFGLSFGLIFLGCDAPRYNPIDPLNPNNKLNQLSGFVYTKSVPQGPIPVATILWQPAGRLSQTNTSGEFAFNDLQPSSGWLIVSKNGFSTDSSFVDLSQKEVKARNFFLNAEPVVNSIIFLSEVENRYPTTKRTKLKIMATIKDADNDIDSVFIRNDQLGLKKVLDFNSSKQEYEKDFTPYELGVENLEQLIGRDFKVDVKDYSGVTFSIGTARLKRIIYDEIEFDTPSNNEQVLGPVHLFWRFFNPGFDFYYGIKIFTDEIFDKELVWEKEYVSSDLNSILVEQDLPNGDYFWVIWCVDEYGNSSRSKPASFTISGN
jgi:hypothetical protein